MTAAFDGSTYRREVLSQLRERNPAEVDDLFWLAHVPPDLDDPAAIASRLRDSKGFLNKERSRARQAAIATAVLKEWPRIESTLTDAGSRRALRERLQSAPRAAARPQAQPTRRAQRPEDPQARRRRQVVANLNEVARLRDDAELAADLFVFLGLPVTATREMIEQRLTRVGEVNRRRRPDRERTVVDELLVQARDLLVGGDPASYLASLATDARDATVDALLNADVETAIRSRERAREHGVGDAAILAELADPAGRSTSVVPVSSLGLGVWCASCGALVAAGADCARCGTSLHLACPSCRTLNLVDAPACGSCGAALDAPRATLIEGRGERAAEQQALQELDAAPEGERTARLAQLARDHPTWPEVRRRRQSVPPAPPAQVLLTHADGEARLAWPKSPNAAVDAYLVERHDPPGSRVLGRTALTTWTDAQPAGPGVTWTVRALRGNAAASAPTTATASDVPGVASPTSALQDVQAHGAAAIELRWTAPPGADIAVTRVERRDDGDVHRQLSVDPDGYRDRQVARGRTYEYRVGLAGSDAAPAVLVVTAGSGETVTPARTGLRPPASTGGAAVIGGLSTGREADGRLRLRWDWPAGVTEAWIAYADVPPAAAVPPGRKITNVRYDLDGGALLEDVPPGTHVAVFAGRRDAAGTLHWGAAQPGSRAVAP